jgi:hypothetical protein
MLPLLLLSASCCAFASETAHHEGAASPPRRTGSSKADTAHRGPVPGPAGHGVPAASQEAHPDSLKPPAAHAPAAHGQKTVPAPAIPGTGKHPEPPRKQPAKDAKVANPKGTHGEEAGEKEAGAKGATAKEADAKDSHPEDAHAKDSHANSVAPGKETSDGGPERESGDVPSLRPRPDTAFARAADWERGEAEILEYSVTRSGRDGDGRYRGRLVTERLFLRTDGTTARSGSKGDTEILNASLTVSGEAGGIPSSSETVSQFPRAGLFALLRQEQSLQGWPGVTHRSLDCRPTPPRLRIASSGGEAPRDTALARWPVYTQEMLFTYLRAIPLRAGYREETWLQDWGEEGRMPAKPRYAAIAVREHAPGIRDMDTWYVTVDREDGRRSEFWVGASGLHPIVVARLADGSEWALQGIARRKYRSW